MGVKYLKKKASTTLVFIILITTSILTVSGNEYIENIEKEEQLIIHKQEIDRSMVQNDYLLGHWKFNENSGNTAHDSSAHEYDGTIYGASWTSGYSSYALNFDGNNDYVSLDNYAANKLGFNKTDDLIFSLYFKTTQTTKGVMYSVSAPDYNPGSHIAMNANGTIEFKMWRLSCGLILTSEGVYNDGQWHYLEVWYNGMPANPVAKIYVDDELDNSKEYYVCQFDADMFTKAKIGTRSNDTENYFDGIIDEVKIIKYPGGNEQNPPVIDGPTKGEAGVRYDFSFTTNDPEEDQIQLYIDWDDGSNTGWFGWFDSGEEVIRSHVYSENGSYEIHSQSRDVWDNSHSSKHLIRIGDLPPDAPTISGPDMGDSKVEYEFTFQAYDHEGNEIWYYIDWGDDEIEEWIGPYESNQEIKVKHIWSNKGIYEINARAKDHLGEGEWADPHKIVIDNDPPNMPTITGPTSGVIGEVYQFNFTVEDPDGDNVYYYIYWDDGDTQLNFGPYASGDKITLSHSWDARETFSIKARARDSYGHFGKNGTFLVIIPKSHYIWFNGFLERFPRLQRIIEVLENIRT
jgi:hypothetical protein